MIVLRYFFLLKILWNESKRVLILKGWVNKVIPFVLIGIIATVIVESSIPDTAVNNQQHHTSDYTEHKDETCANIHRSGRGTDNEQVKFSLTPCK